MSEEPAEGRIEAVRWVFSSYGFTTTIGLIGDDEYRLTSDGPASSVLTHVGLHGSAKSWNNAVWMAHEMNRDAHALAELAHQAEALASKRYAAEVSS